MKQYYKALCLALAGALYCILPSYSFWFDHDYVFGKNENPLSDLFIVETSQPRFGFVDRSGNTVIPANFSWAYDFHDGIATVRKDWLWGAIDTTGTMILEPEYYGIGQYSEGLVPVKLMSGRYIYLDLKGEKKIDAEFEIASEFSEGLAPVKLSQSTKFGYIDRTGKIVIPAIFDGARTFSEGLAPVMVRNKSGFIDHNGDMIISSPNIVLCSQFSQGFALVSLRNPDGTTTGVLKCGFIDKAGNVAFGTKFANARSFSEDLAAVSDGSTWSFIDTAGKVVLSGFKTAGSFHEGLAPVQLGEEFGFIDKSGHIVLKVPDDSDAGAFYCGRAVTMKKGPWTDGTPCRFYTKLPKSQ